MRINIDLPDRVVAILQTEAKAQKRERKPHLEHILIEHAASVKFKAQTKKGGDAK